jgi:fatty acid desaturase
MAASSPALDRFERSELVDRQGRSFKQFRRTLAPRFGRVWFDIAMGWVGLALVAAALVAVDRHQPAARPLAVVLGALAFGYLVAYLMLFFHEAAHYNIAAGRRANDLLANLLVGLFAGQDIKAYRVVHFDHHRHLGTPRDTEHSYWDAPGIRFFVEALFGIKAAAVLLARGKRVEQESSDGKPAERSSARFMLLAGLAFNGAILALALWLPSSTLLLAWPLGVLVIHPAINATRQLLEHRSFDADSRIDYGKVAHGATTRMFGSGPISSTLGGAGFNRHLLHHWEPQISYTRFAELEAFLLDTAAAGVVRDAKTTYARALLRLLRAP